MSDMIEVLLVEDDPGDVLMTEEAFAEYKVANKLHVVSDGESAMAFLRKQGPYAGAATPDLVLLDLHLPHRPRHQARRLRALPPGGPQDRRLLRLRRAPPRTLSGGRAGMNTAHRALSEAMDE